MSCFNSRSYTNAINSQLSATFANLSFATTNRSSVQTTYIGTYPPPAPSQCTFAGPSPDGGLFYTCSTSSPCRSIIVYSDGSWSCDVV